MKECPETITFPDGIHLSQYLDGDLEALAHENITRSMDSNPVLRDEMDGLRDTIAVLNHMPSRQAPSHSNVASDYRPRRRFRAADIGYWPQVSRFPFEAAFNIVLMALLMVLYLGVLPATDIEVKPAFNVPSEQGRK